MKSGVEARKMADMSKLAQRFADDGYVFPIDALNGEEALSCRREPESLQERATGKKIVASVQSHLLAQMVQHV